MGGFVAVYNAGTFRLEAAPYALSPALAGLVFLAYLLGSASSPTAGALAERFGRRLVVPAAVGLMAAGIALTLPAPLWCVVLGLCVLTTGFFAAHGVASGWVAARAQLGGRAVGQAASLYSFWYYVGSSVGRHAGRPRVVRRRVARRRRAGGELDAGRAAAQPGAGPDAFPGGPLSGGPREDAGQAVVSSVPSVASCS